MNTSVMGNENPSEHRIKTPWHLWLVAVFVTLIYSIGIYDYVSVHGNNTEYLNSLNTNGDVIAYFANYPLVFSALWTVNVFGAPIAVVLLILRIKWAVWGAFLAALSKLCLDILTFSLWNRWSVFGPWLSLIDITVLLLTWAFYLYCRGMARRGYFYLTKSNYVS